MEVVFRNDVVLEIQANQQNFLVELESDKWYYMTLATDRQEDKLFIEPKASIRKKFLKGEEL